MAGGQSHLWYEKSKFKLPCRGLYMRCDLTCLSFIIDMQIKLLTTIT
jgi:hypothetical protein